MDIINNCTIRHNFPLILQSMLDDSITNGFEDVVSWLPNTNYFKVHNRKSFNDQIMKLYFPRQNVHKSFLRQLNLYGIERINVAGSPYQGAYYHNLLVRGRKDLARRICRVKASPPVKKQQTTTMSSSALLPPYYPHDQHANNNNNNNGGSLWAGNWTSTLGQGYAHQQEQEQGMIVGEESSPLRGGFVHEQQQQEEIQQKQQQQPLPPTPPFINAIETMPTPIFDGDKNALLTTTSSTSRQLTRSIIPEDMFDDIIYIFGGRK